TVYGKAVRLSGQSSGCAQFSANGTLTSSGVSCGTGSGSGGADPFPNHATSTTLYFNNGLVSTASTTFNSSVYFPNLSAGLAFIGTNGLHASVATSTLTASSPLTGSFTQIGSGGSLGCQTASGSLAGCLSSTDWSTFNSKQATIS